MQASATLPKNKAAIFLPSSFVYCFFVKPMIKPAVVYLNVGSEFLYFYKFKHTLKEISFYLYSVFSPKILSNSHCATLVTTIKYCERKTYTMSYFGGNLSKYFYYALFKLTRQSLMFSCNLKVTALPMVETAA